MFLNLVWWSTRLKARVTNFDRVNLFFFFFINQNDVVLVKNKKIVNRLQLGFDRIIPGLTTKLGLNTLFLATFIFFINLAWF
jgi:hypothetical protein